MNYHSNLPQPDLTGFVLRDPPKQMLGGHDGPSDPDFEPECTYWTHDEGAILYAVALTIGGPWLDIGARLGWTAACIASAAPAVSLVEAVEPEFDNFAFYRRFNDNHNAVKAQLADVHLFHGTREAFTSAFHKHRLLGPFYGCVIDGNHDFPEPLNDAKGCLSMMAQPDCVIFFHDFWGRPVQDGVTFLQRQGFRTRIYNTPNGVALCWRGFEGWAPPEHIPDPAIGWQGIRNTVQDFDWSRCE